MIQTMRLTKVLFSGLLLSAAFVGCTNDEFADIQPVNTKGALPLGENFTISVSKGADTKAAFGSSLSPVWETGDQLGAAWYYMVVDENDTPSEVEEGEASQIGSTFGGLYSNHPFTLTKGAGTNAGTFQSLTNAFAGAYILYYPYDAEVKETSKFIPVEIAARQEFDAAAGKELQAVNANMFSYCPAAFVPGGTQTGDFSLQQVPVLFRLRFEADPKLSMVLGNGISFEKIILTATDASGDYVTVTEGKVTTDEEPKYTDFANNGEGLTAKYEGDVNSAVDHFSIDLKNASGANYTITKVSEPTAGYFYFSTLPFLDKATKVTVKVVASNGLVFAKDYNNANTADQKYITEFNDAVNEGGQVSVKVILDVTKADNVIYTEAQFKAAWDAAVKETTPQTLTVGESLDLSDMTLTCANDKADITVKSALTDGQKLTVNSLNITKGSVDFETPLVVKDAINTTGDVDFKAVDLTAEGTVNIEGYAELTATSIKDLYVASSGVVIVTGKNSDAVIETVTVNKGATSKGELTLKTIEVGDLSSTGNVIIGDANVVATGAFSSQGTLTLNADFVNTGEFVQEGEFAGTGKFINAAGATLTTKAAGSANVENRAADETKNLPAAVWNIELASGEKLSAAGSNNEGIVDLKSGEVTSFSQKGEDAARIYVSKDGWLNATNTNITSGYVIVLDKSAKIHSTLRTANNSAYEISSTTKTTDIATQVGTYFINGAYTIDATNAATIQAKNLVVKANLTLGTNVTLAGNFEVAGTVTISAETGKTPTLTLSSSATNNTIDAGATLKIGKNVTLSADAATDLTVEKGGKFDADAGATIDSSVTVKYN